jgi:hypothetical protein
VGWLRGKIAACAVGAVCRNFTDGGFLFSKIAVFDFSSQPNFEKLG